jgi:hypothetical protein
MAARCATAIAALLAAACGSGELTRTHATTVIQQQLFPKGTVDVVITFEEGHQCLRRDNDVRTHMVEALQRLGYLTVAISPDRAPCETSEKRAHITLTAKGIPRVGRDDWALAAGTHTLALARQSLVKVTRVERRGPNMAMAIFLIREVRTPIGEETDVVGTAQPSMQVEFNRVGNAWRIGTLMQ